MFDTMEEDEIENGNKQEIGETPPEVSISSLINTFRKRGIMATLDDENLGPHTHLLLLLGIVFIISIIIGIYLAVA
jgi:hypothetical protein